eukprot:3398900-Lingulodinium_polyedra.AAC.1
MYNTQPSPSVARHACCFVGGPDTSTSRMVERGNTGPLDPAMERTNTHDPVTEQGGDMVRTTTARATP